MLYEKLVITNSTDKRVFIVPAFEYIGGRVPVIPLTKDELLIELDAQRIQIFRQNLWFKGHAVTDYDHWRNTDREYSVY